MIEIREGQAPLIVTFPHTGTEVPADVLAQMARPDLALTDTDWRVHDLYAFVSEFDATTLRTPISRSVIDVNRDPSGASLYPGQATTGLVPVETFAGVPLYEADRAPDAMEIGRRKSTYYDPFHEAVEAQIARLKATHGQIVLYDCHSILSHVPRLFEGTLPIFNIGTDGGRTCTPTLQEAVVEHCAATGLGHVVNGRFQGGWITRHYGNPDDGVHALQMELAMRFYMNEADADDPAPATMAEAQAHLRPLMNAVAEIAKTVAA